MTTPVIIAARRTPIATSGRALRTYDAIGLAATVWRALRHDSDAIEPGLVPDDVILGMARGPGGNPARVSVLESGWPVDVPAVTIDRQCGAGLDAICLAAAEVASGAAQVVVAGGSESGSAAEPGRSRFAPEAFGDPEMGPAAEDLALRRRISRQRQDDYAFRSHERACRAREAGLFAPELVPVDGLTMDDRPRRLRPEVLRRAPSAFAADGTVTAANSCAISDGAAGVVIVSEEVRSRLGVPGLAITGWARAGVDPRWPGIGPTPAIRSALSTQRWQVADLDRIEITEAFAAQVLSCLADLGLDDDDPRVCADGGAIALGHPWGASGAVLAVRLFTAMVLQSEGRRGLATCAIGGGQGIAMTVEVVGR